MLFSHIESQTIVSENIIRVKTVIVDQMRVVVVDDGAEGEAAPPAGGHVQDVDVGVAGGDLPGPGLQRLGSSHCHDEDCCDVVFTLS